MSSVFEIAILKLQALGFFQFLLPFILTSAIIYGGLRRAQLFGDADKTVAVNAVIALVVSLFVWAAPIILGINVEAKLSTFFIQGFSVSLVVLFGLIFASMFFEPDIAKRLSEKMKSSYFWGAVIVVALITGIVILVSSGLATILFPKGIGVKLSSNVIVTSIVAVAMVAVVFLVIRSAGGSK